MSESLTDLAYTEEVKAQLKSISEKLTDSEVETFTSVITLGFVLKLHNALETKEIRQNQIWQFILEVIQDSKERLIVPTENENESESSDGDDQWL